MRNNEEPAWIFVGVCGAVMFSIIGCDWYLRHQIPTSNQDQREDTIESASARGLPLLTIPIASIIMLVLFFSYKAYLNRRREQLQLPIIDLGEQPLLIDLEAPPLPIPLSVINFDSNKKYTKEIVSKQQKLHQLLDGKIARALNQISVTQKEILKTKIDAVKEQMGKSVEEGGITCPIFSKTLHTPVRCSLEVKNRMVPLNDAQIFYTQIPPPLNTLTENRSINGQTIVLIVDLLTQKQVINNLENMIKNLEDLLISFPLISVKGLEEKKYTPPKSNMLAGNSMLIKRNAKGKPRESEDKSALTKTTSLGKKS